MCDGVKDCRGGEDEGTSPHMAEGECAPKKKTEKGCASMLYMDAFGGKTCTIAKDDKEKELMNDGKNVWFCGVGRKGFEMKIYYIGDWMNELLTSDDTQIKAWRDAGRFDGYKANAWYIDNSGYEGFPYGGIGKGYSLQGGGSLAQVSTANCPPLGFRDQERSSYFELKWAPEGVNWVPKGTSSCNAGFSKDTDGVCQDINECTDGTHNCDKTNADCTNTSGAFTCKCKTGFVGNGQKCAVVADTNECTDGTHKCDRTNADCTNTPGSYTCKCKTGFTGDGKTCKKDEVKGKKLPSYFWYRLLSLTIGFVKNPSLFKSR